MGGINTYGYVGGNPLFWYDYKGLKSTSIRPQPRANTGGAGRPTVPGEYTGGRKAPLPSPIRVPNGYRDPIGDLFPPDPRDYLCTFSINCKYTLMCQYTCF